MAVYADHRETIEKPSPPEEQKSPVDLPDISSLIASLGGQEGISAKLNSLLGTSPSQEEPHDTPAAPKGGSIPDLSSLLSGASPNMLSGLLGNTSKPNSPCGRLCALVTGITPFLAPAKQIKAKKALQILQILGATEKPVIEDDRLPLILLMMYLFFLP